MKRVLLLAIVLIVTSCNAQLQNSNSMKNILSPYQFTTHYTSLKDGELGYVKEGKGKETIIFIHGLSSNADAWSKNISELQKDFTCYALDLPGYGRSYKDNKDFTPTYFAQILNEFTQKMGIKNFILVGHSMGGQAAIKYAATYTDKVKKLVLIAPAGIEEFTDFEALTMKAVTNKEGIKATSDEQIDKNYAINFHQMPKEAHQMIVDRKNIKKADDFDAHALAIEKSIKGMLDDKVITDIPNIKLPVLLLFAENDLLIPNRYFHAQMTIKDVAEKAQKSFTNSSLMMIPESGHFLQFEQPEIVNEQIKNFIKN